MTTWSDAIFASDLAADVRAEFDDALRFGLPVDQSTAAVLSKYRELLDDPRDGPVIVFCLAALQLEADQLHRGTRDAAVGLIRDESIVRMWGGSDAARKREMRSVLETFEADLLAADVIDDDGPIDTPADTEV